MMSTQRKPMEGVLNWRLGAYGEIQSLPESEHILRNDGKESPILTERFQKYLNNIGEVLNLRFKHYPTHRPSEYGVGTYGKCVLDGKAEVFVYDAWAYHVVDVKALPIVNLERFHRALVAAGEIPGVRPYGHADQKTGFSDLQEEVKRTKHRVREMNYHVDSSVSFLGMLTRLQKEL